MRALEELLRGMMAYEPAERSGAGYGIGVHGEVGNTGLGETTEEATGETEGRRAQENLAFHQFFI